MDILEVISSSPLLVYILGAVLLLHLVIKLYPEAFGAVGRWLDDRSARKRQAAADRDDADIAELRRQTHHLSERVGALAALVAEMRHAQLDHDSLLVEHARWDRYMLAALVAADPASIIPDPPPLWPPPPADPPVPKE